MSVSLKSKGGKINESISNGGWSAIVAHSRVFDAQILHWNGCHDGQEWTPDQLRVMADRLQQSAEWIPILRELADDGGVKIS
jgi:hypothetical protein